MARKPLAPLSIKHRMRGFEPAFRLVSGQVRQAGEVRGFAVARLVTHWAEVVGEELARVTRPVKVGYSRDGMGASLTLLVQGAMAPMVEMQKESIREKVNAVYGYSAISRVVLTQTAAAGFSDGQAAFTAAPKAKPEPSPAVVARAQDTAEGISDPGLRDALERLAQNIFTRSDTK